MMQDALIIFVRNPVAGKVKTRIAAAAGDAIALAVYQKLLQHTYSITHLLQYDKYVFYADAVAADDMWSGGGFIKMLQQKGNLGYRMYSAFKHLFQKGYKKVCIIGSDCFELESHIIHQAFELLDKTDFVVGPATDGGYYLLAMQQATNVFENIEWSTDKVLQQTLASIQQQHFNFYLLAPLTDIDTAADIPETWKDELQWYVQKE